MCQHCGNGPLLCPLACPGCGTNICLDVHDINGENVREVRDRVYPMETDRYGCLWCRDCVPEKRFEE